MSKQNNIFNTEHRRKFIKNTTINTLNEYLKNLQKLSLKGGKYLDIYNEDINFLMDNDDVIENIFQKGGNIFDMLVGNKKGESKKSEINVGDTEVFVKNINNLTRNKN